MHGEGSIAEGQSRNYAEIIIPIDQAQVDRRLMLGLLSTSRGNAPSRQGASLIQIMTVEVARTRGHPSPGAVTLRFPTVFIASPIQPAHIRQRSVTYTAAR